MVSARLSALLILCVTASAAFAQGSLEYSIPSLAQQRQAQPFSLGTGLVFYEYKEPGFMKIHGRLTEVNGTFRMPLTTPKIPMWVGLNVRYAQGRDLSYDGGLQDSSSGKVVVTPASSFSKDRFLDVRLLAAADVVDGPVSNVEVFAGLARWSLVNKVANMPQEPKPTSYERDVYYWYMPIGVDYNLKLSSALTWVSGLEYDRYLYGQTTSRMSEIDSSNSDIDHIQLSGAGYRVKTGAEMKLSQMSVGILAYYQIWVIDQSEPVSATTPKGNTLTIVEPDNRTGMVGVNLVARF